MVEHIWVNWTWGPITPSIFNDRLGGPTLAQENEASFRSGIF